MRAVLCQFMPRFPDENMFSLHNQEMERKEFVDKKINICYNSKEKIVDFYEGESYEKI